MKFTKPKKKWGQNFLVDKNLCNKIVNSFNIKPNDHILEIGPGKGAITNLLTKKARKVTAIEIDSNLCEILNQKNISNLEIINEDILKINLEKYNSKIIVGNLPYYITTPIIFYFFELSKNWEQMYFLVQKEVAERITADPGSKTYGRLSIMTQIFSDIKILFNVHPKMFRPIPKVQSSLIYIKKNKIQEAINYSRFRDIIRIIFNQRRKKLKNCITKEMNLNIPDGSELFNKRPEEISIEEYIQIIN